MSDSLSDRLQSLLGRLERGETTGASNVNLTEKDVDTLAEGLISPTAWPILLQDDSDFAKRFASASDRDQDRSNVRTMAFLCLSRCLSPNPPSSSSSSSHLQVTSSDVVISESLGKYITNSLSDTEPFTILKSLSLLAALLQLAPTQSARLLASSSIPSSETSPIEEKPIWDSLIEFAELPELFQTRRLALTIQLAVVEILSLASGIQSLRALVKTKAEGWLKVIASSSGKPTPGRTDTGVEFTAEDKVENDLKNQMNVSAVVALIKLARGGKSDQLMAAMSGSTSGITGSEATSTLSDKTTTTEDLAKKLSRLLVSSQPTSSVLNLDSTVTAIEGLAYASLEPRVKDDLAHDRILLGSLFELCVAIQNGSLAFHSSTATTSSSSSSSKPKPSSSLSASYNLTDRDLDEHGRPRNESTALVFGIATIISNIISRRAKLTEEQQQIEKLRSMASAGMTAQKGTTMGAASTGSSLGEGKVDAKLESDEVVTKRIKLVLKSGVVAALSSLAKIESGRVEEMIGKIMLELVTDKEDRLMVVSQGGAKVTMSVVKNLMANVKITATTQKAEGEANLFGSNNVFSNVPDTILPGIQALAKLIINIPPSNLFGAHPASSALDYIRPLSLLLQHHSSNLLQQFESLMALTNLASIHPQVAKRILVQDNGSVIQKIENDLLAENVMVRRAAVEVVCNLIGCEEAFCRFSGDELDPSITSTSTLTSTSTFTSTSPTRKPTAAARSRLHILLALTDVYDLPTRSAASGALATLTQSPRACELLLSLNNDGGEGQNTDKSGFKVFDILKRMLEPVIARNEDDDEEEDAEEEEVEAIEEISTSPPDAGLVHRTSIILFNLYSYMNSLPSASSEDSKKKKTLFDAVVKSGIVTRQLDLLTSWTEQLRVDGQEGGMTGKEALPDKDVVEATIECLKILKENGVMLVRS